MCKINNSLNYRRFYLFAVKRFQVLFYQPEITYAIDNWLLVFEYFIVMVSIPPNFIVHCINQILPDQIPAPDPSGLGSRRRLRANLPSRRPQRANWFSKFLSKGEPDRPVARSSSWWAGRGSRRRGHPWTFFGRKKIKIFENKNKLIDFYTAEAA